VYVFSKQASRYAAIFIIQAEFFALSERLNNALWHLPVEAPEHRRMLRRIAHHKTRTTGKSVAVCCTPRR
jgi:hypothetical protein